MEEFGYAIVTAANSTCLVWELINNVDNTILDKMVITQPPSFPSSFGMDQHSYEKANTADNANYKKEYGIGFGICVLTAVICWTYIRAKENASPHSSTSGKKSFPVQYQHHADELIPLAMSLRKISINTAPLSAE